MQKIVAMPLIGRMETFENQVQIAVPLQTNKSA